MSRIVFWDFGHGGAEGIAAAVAIAVALYHRQHILLVNEAEAGYGVEQGFPVQDHIAAAGDGKMVAETGTEALLRLLHNRRLSRHNFADYTRPLINGRLDLVAGARGGIDKQVDEILLQQLYAIAEDSYELVLLHRSGRFIPNEELEPELLFPVLHQNRTELDHFFELYRSSLQNSANRVSGIVLRNYDRQAKWNIANIRRYYDCDLPIYGICYETGFADAWNERDLLRYFRRIQLPGRTGTKRGTLLEALQELAEGVIELCGKYTVSRSPSNDKGA